MALGITSVSTIALIGFVMGKVSMQEESFNKLRAIREMKGSQIEDYFIFIGNQIATYSQNTMVIDAINEFKISYNSIEEELNLTTDSLKKIDERLESYYKSEFLPRIQQNLSFQAQLAEYYSLTDRAKVLQDLYIYSNPNPVGSKQQLIRTEKKNSYGRVHQKYHPIFLNFLQNFGYYDLFLVDAVNGNILYSVFKEVDFGTSLDTGPYSKTNFAKAYRMAKQSNDFAYTILEDFEPYPPSYNQPASFIASPIFDQNEMIGVLIFQLPVNQINEIMTSHEKWTEVGLGKTGETYIVGEDTTLRNQSRFLIEDRSNYFKMITDIGTDSMTVNQIRNFNTTIGIQKVVTEGTIQALNGSTGEQIFEDYRGVSVLSSYKPLDILGVNWVLMSEIDEAEAFSNIQKYKGNVLLAASIILLILMILAAFFSKSIIKPIKELINSAAVLAEGDLKVTIPVERKDEIGALSRSFELMRGNIKKLVDNLNDVNTNLENLVNQRTAQLEKANTRVASIIKNASDAIITIDSSFKISQFNPAAEQIFGYTKEEIIDHPLRKLMPEKSASIHDGLIREFSKADVNSRLMEQRDSLLGKRKDGELFPIEAGISKMYLEGEMYFTAFLRDISERRLMEQKIQEAYKLIKKQKDRMENELNVARDIQMSMLPLHFTKQPEKEEVDISAIVEPAREVGGDFYNYFYIDKTHLCFLVGDVSGKGVPGALLMAVTQALLKSESNENLSTGHILSHVNNQISEENTSYMFVTVFMAILDIKTGILKYTNAGHNPTILKRKDETVEKLSELHGPVIGAMENIDYKETHIQINKGDYILAYTDGLTEAHNKSGEMYSEERLLKLIHSMSIFNSEQAMNKILDDCKDFAKQVEQFDDITILSLRYIQ
jgi:PAS domain S-box-containing protein